MNNFKKVFMRKRKKKVMTAFSIYYKRGVKPSLK